MLFHSIQGFHGGIVQQILSANNENFAAGWSAYLPLILGAGAAAAAALSNLVHANQEKSKAKKLAQCQENFKILIENTSDGVCVTRLDKILFCNSQLGAMTGYSPQDLREKNFSDLIHQEDRDFVKQQFVDLGSDSCLSQTPVRLITQKGETRWATLQYHYSHWQNEPAILTLLKDFTEAREKVKTISSHHENEVSHRLGGIALDSTEKNWIEHELKNGQERYKQLFRHLPLGIFYYNHALRITDFNPHFMKTLRSTAKRIQGYQLAAMENQTILPALTSALDGAEGFYEGPYHTPSGKETVYVSLRTAPDYGESRSIIGGLGIMEDITERRQKEMQIQKQLQQLSALRAVELAIANNTDLASTLKVLLQEVVSQLGVDAAALLLLNPENMMLQFAAEQGFKTPFIRHTSLPLGQGYAGEVALSGKMVLITPEGEDANRFMTSPMVSAEGFRSYCAVPLLVKGIVKGVLEIYHRSALEGSPDWIDFLQILAGHAGIAIENSTLFEELQRANTELIRAYDSTIEGWARALELRDGETEGHSQRVTKMAVDLACRVGFHEDDLIQIRRGALLHDIGKMAIPDNILLKPGELSEEEWKVMRRHPVYAFHLLSSVDFLRPALDIPYYHHERWDGSGYPRGLQGDEIPKAARVFSIVDVWDALLSDRPYRKAWEREKVMDYLKQQSGKFFDPWTLREFLRLQNQ